MLRSGRSTGYRWAKRKRKSKRVSSVCLHTGRSTWLELRRQGLLRRCRGRVQNRLFTQPQQRPLKTEKERQRKIHAHYQVMAFYNGLWAVGGDGTSSLDRHKVL